LGKYSNAKLIQKQPTISTTYKFQDENEEEISTDIIKRQDVLDVDWSTKKAIDGYEFIALKQGEDNTWIWVYKKVKNITPVQGEIISAPNTGIRIRNYGAEVEILAFSALILIVTGFGRLLKADL
jgi:hypothetical protein